MEKFNILIKTIEEIESIVQKLAENQPKPDQDIFNKEQIYDYKVEEKNEELAIFLKILRLISLSNASLYLIKEGYIHECSIICRAIGEVCEDIYLIYLIFIAKNSTSNISDLNQYINLKEKLIFYFYNEEEKNKSIVRRSDIQNVLNALEEKIMGVEDSQLRKKLYDFYSKFVHSNCKIIINSFYDMKDEKYILNGKSILIDYFIENFFYHIYHVIVTIQQAFIILKKFDLEQRICLSGLNFLKNGKVPLLSDAGIEEYETHYHAKFTLQEGSKKIV